MYHPLTFVFVAVILGCSEVVPGTCYPNPAGGAGGAGSIPTDPGVGASSGDFISPPPSGPLDYGGDPDPCIVPQSPCNEKCLADYANLAAECGKIADATQRRTCQDSAYARYKNCGESCPPQQLDEKCRQACDRIYDDCMSKCKDGPWRDACFRDYSACLKKCGR